MQEIKQEDIKNVIDGIISNSDNESYKIYQELFSKIDFDITDIERYDLQMNYKYKKFTRALIKAKISSKEDVVFIFQNYSFVSHQFRHFIQLIDGWPFSADRNRTIIRKLLNYLIKDEKIEFSKDSKISYGTPKNVFTNHDSIVSFFEAIKSLYFGDSKSYLNELIKMKSLME